MRLGYVSHSPLAYDGHAYYYKAGEWSYIEALSSLFELVDICAPIIHLSGEQSDHDFSNQLSIPNAQIYDLAPTTNIGKSVGWLGRRLATLRTLSRLSGTWDFALVMAPGWSALQAWALSRWHKWNYAVCFIADWVHQTEYHLPVILRRQLFIKPYLRLVKKFESWIMYDATIRMTEGQVLNDRYPELQSTILTSVTMKLAVEEFRRREDTCTTLPIKLITIGSVIKLKGMDIIIRALKELHFRHHVELHIVGTGNARSELEQLASSLQLEECVRFHGYISDSHRILNLLYESDIFVLTSYSEGFPRVIYEAMSQSLPVVTSSVGGIPLTLADEHTALLVEPGDPIGTAVAIERIICDDELRHRLITHGFQFAYDVISSNPVETAMQAVREVLKLHDGS